MESSKASLQWPPLESNPDILSDYLLEIGLDPRWAIYECYGLDDDLLSFIFFANS